MKSKKTIVISILSVWSIRNFILSGIIDELATENTVIVSTNTSFAPLLKEYGIQNILIVPKLHQNKFSKFIYSILQNSFTLNSKIRPVYKLNHELYVKNLTLYSTFTTKAVYFISSIISSLNLFYLLEKIWLNLVKDSVPKEFMADLADVKPDLIISTSFVLPEDRTLMFSSISLKIKIITHILSFDNITSRGYLPIRFFDLFMVWNQGMAEELKTLYLIDENKIILTGTPQFYFHNKLLKEVEAASKYATIKDKTSKDYFLYCGNHWYHTPNEPELLDYLVQNLMKEPEYKKHHWVIRPHPLDDYSRWDWVLNKYPDIIKLSKPWDKFDFDKPHIGHIKKEDLINFVNIINNCYCVFNIASTVTIDASILNKPVFCIGFHPNHKKDNSYYYDVHFSNHYNRIISFDASPLVRDFDELLTLLKELQKEDSRIINRNNLVKYFIGDTLEVSKKLILENIRENV